VLLAQKEPLFSKYGCIAFLFLFFPLLVNDGYGEGEKVILMLFELCLFGVAVCDVSCGFL